MKISSVYRVALWVLVALALGLVVVHAGPTSQKRKYPERIPVRFWHRWTGEWAVIVEDICDRFNESQSKYEVIPLSIPGDMADSKVILGVIGGDPPDVTTDWGQSIQNWADNDLLTPYDELMTDGELRQYREVTDGFMLKSGTYKGRIYGVSTSGAVAACFYRTDHLREAGLDPDRLPETLEELAAWGEKLDRYDSQGRLTRVGFLPRLLIDYAPLFGGGFYDWKEQRVTIHTPENVRALSFLVDARKRLGFEDVIRFESALPTGQGQLAGEMFHFINGYYSIFVDRQYRIPQLKEYAPGLDYRVGPIPAPAGGKALGCWGNANNLVIPRGARSKQGAWEFVKFWSGTSDRNMEAEFAIALRNLPASVPASRSDRFQAYIRQYPAYRTFLEVASSPNVQPLPPIPYITFFWDNVLATEDCALRGTLTPDEALRQFDDSIQREVERRKEMGYED